MNQASCYWVTAGKFESAQCGDPSLITQQDRSFYDRGAVRLIAGPNGAELRWRTQSPCITSLFALMNWLANTSTPVVLRFHASGWFEEFYEDTETAIDRMEQIIARCDRQIQRRTIVEEVEPRQGIISDFLLDLLTNPVAIEDYSVGCFYSPAMARFCVDRIGEKSTIAQLCGHSTISFPGSVSHFADRVSEGYRQVLETGKPRADHVLATLRLPDGEFYWVPHHRLVLPVATCGLFERVQVISQIAPVFHQFI